MSTSNFYLEHYLDSLESLPGELRRNFTLMHDLDTKNQAILQNVDSAAEEYLRKVKETSSEQRKSEMEKIQRMFKKAKEYGDDKVTLAIQTYELVDKHIRRLDSDLAKFEGEMKEKGRLSYSDEENEEEQTEREQDEVEEKNEQAKQNETEKMDVKTPKGGVKGKKNSNRAPDKNIKKDKKTGSGIKENHSLKESKETEKKKKSKFKSETPRPNSPLTSVPSIPKDVLDMPVDPNEPTYCLCNQVSYGEMIGCDNQDCPIEWFHFECMGLSTKPKGKWYCPKCHPMFKKKKQL